MSASIIDGKATAKEIKQEVAKKAEVYAAEFGRKPGLAVVIVGDDPASRVYVNGKKKACAEVGLLSEEYALPEKTTQEELLSLVDRLNASEHIDGILVQLPLPSHLNEDEIIARIDPRKDVDGFHPVSAGNLVIGRQCLKPCTPTGIIELIRRTGVEINGKKAVVIGRSNIVGKPVAMMLLGENATVTICHSKTVNLAETCREADILVAAVGRPEMVKGSWIKPGAVVIDVGVNRLADKKLVGDVDFEEAKEVAGYITPVPGGVGPMTITMLMNNTVEAAFNSRGCEYGK